MNLIHINRAGQSMGPFPEDEVLEGLRTGKFLPSDLAWQSGEPEWRPLSELAPKLWAKRGTATPPDAPPLPEGVGLSPAWERRSQIGLLAALVETVQEVLMQPGPTFTRMQTRGGFGGPLLYYMIVGWLSTGISTLYQFGFALIDPSEWQDLPFEVGTPIFFVVALVVTLFFVPLVVFIGAFLGAGLTHLLLMLVGGAKKNFEVTFRVLCYTYGTCSLFQIIPFCGPFLHAVYGIIVAAIGLSKAHEIEVWRAALAILLPVILCCGFVMVIVFFAAAVAGASLIPGL